MVIILMEKRVPITTFSLREIGLGGYFLYIESNEPAIAQKRQPTATMGVGWLNLAGGRVGSIDWN